MIYEFRKYDLKPRTLAQYDSTVEKALAGGRPDYSPLFGYWYSEFGQLNQALHIWPYRDLRERTEVREQVADVGYWPPATQDLLAGQNTEIYMPAPQTGSPMTYMWKGKQYIVVAVSDRTYSGEFLAFRLPG